MIRLLVGGRGSSAEHACDCRSSGNKHAPTCKAASGYVRGRLTGHSCARLCAGQEEHTLPSLLTLPMLAQPLY